MASRRAADKIRQSWQSISRGHSRIQARTTSSFPLERSTEPDVGRQPCRHESACHSNRSLAHPKPQLSRLARPQPSEAPSSVVRSLHTSTRRSRFVTGVGSEPGIDPNVSNPKWDRLNALPQADSDIKVIDYSRDQMIEREVSVSGIDTFVKDEPRPPWAACRWIYVNGINWHVIRHLGSAYKLHPLAIEDVMDTRSPTKVDWYQNHCFLEMNMARLVHTEEDGPLDGADAESILRKIHGNHKWRLLAAGHFGMSVEQVSIFMTDDNTIITIFENGGQEVLNPILARLQSPSTVVRSSNDPSMLLQAVIDAVVDLSLPIGKAVGDAFDNLELAVLSTPKINQSKRLHILRSGLTLLKEHTIATEGLIRSLIDHRAVLNLRAADLSPPDVSPVTNQIPTSVQISPMAQVYLQDVRDHAAGLSNSTSMAIRSTEHLTTLIFNSIAASQNESVRKLTLVSSFFLPLTFLTGYFGMNFDPMPIVNDHSDLYFWYIAIPVMLTTLLLMSTRVGKYGPAAWLRRRRARNLARSSPSKKPE